MGLERQKFIFLSSMILENVSSFLVWFFILFSTISLYYNTSLKTWTATHALDVFINMVCVRSAFKVWSNRCFSIISRNDPIDTRVGWDPNIETSLLSVEPVKSLCFR